YVHPTVVAGIVSAASVKESEPTPAAPDDHLTTSPDGRVKPSCGRHVGRAGSYPAIRLQVVSTSSVQGGEALLATGASPPQNHLPTAPDCGLPNQAIVRAGHGCGYP